MNEFLKLVKTGCVCCYIIIQIHCSETGGDHNTHTQITAQGVQTRRVFGVERRDRVFFCVQRKIVEIKTAKLKNPLYNRAKQETHCGRSQRCG